MNQPLFTKMWTYWESFIKLSQFLINFMWMTVPKISKLSEKLWNLYKLCFHLTFLRISRVKPWKNNWFFLKVLNMITKSEWLKLVLFSLHHMILTFPDMNQNQIVVVFAFWFLNCKLYFLAISLDFLQVLTTKEHKSVTVNDALKWG